MHAEALLLKEQHKALILPVGIVILQVRSCGVNLFDKIIILNNASKNFFII